MILENTVVEISQAPYADGRRKIVVSLHEIYPDEGQWNSNGITWIEPYVSKNAPSIIEMPLCVRYLDQENGVPYDHGLSDVEGNMPIFEESVVVGSCNGWEIRDIKIDGATHKVLCAVGVLYQQREPEFVKWLEDRLTNGETVYSSVEIVAARGNEEVVYRDGWKEFGRIPTEYTYSGHSFLTVRPADGTSIVLELNQKNETEEGKLDEKMITPIIEKMEAKIKEVLEKNEECAAEVSNLQSQLNTANEKIEELNTKLQEAEEALAASKAEKETCETEKTSMEAKLQDAFNALNQAKAEAQKGELNSKLEGFTDEQKAFAKDEIEKFNADPLNAGIEINQIVEKIEACSYRKIEEKRKTEINEFKVDSIFGCVSTNAASDGSLDLDHMFE